MQKGEKNIEEIRVLIGYFYGDSEGDVSPSLIGEKCFDHVLEEAREKEV